MASLHFSESVLQTISQKDVRITSKHCCRNQQELVFKGFKTVGQGNFRETCSSGSNIQHNIIDARQGPILAMGKRFFNTFSRKKDGRSKSQIIYMSDPVFDQLHLQLLKT